MTTKPPMVNSEEATQEDLIYARQQGQAYIEALHHMVNEVADGGGEKQVGDVIVAYANEPAEGLYYYEDDQLKWREPLPSEVHIEVSVRDAGDNRFIPGLGVDVTVEDKFGVEIGTQQHPFLWHPWLHHYGRNWEIPEDGEYNLTVKVSPGPFIRHDKKNGRRFIKPVEVRFEGAHLKTAEA